jgi:putative addiction module component (TIGR02574 family)
MRRDAAEILKEALELPIEGRVALTDSLLESLDTEEVDDGAESAWQRAVERRVAELDSGAVSPLPWADVRRNLIATLRNER